eukprot:SAG22_NODE_2067_length_3057_cov_2.417174_2_plen_499_part_00
MAALLAACALVGSALASNPLVPRIGMADPHMHVFPSNPDVVQLYSTHDCNKGRSGPCVAEPIEPGHSAVGAAGPDFRMIDWWVWSSSDLVSWKLEAKVLPKLLQWDDVNASQECWATDAASFANGTTAFYLSVGPKQIGVVTGPTPNGPFSDPLGKPLIPIGMVPTYSRDPTVLMDDDGTAYLMFGTFNYFVAKLNPDLISLAETPKGVKIMHEQHRDDKPFLHKHNGRYYLSWGCWYAIGDSPYGPFNYSGGVINTTALANTSFASGGGTKDRHGSFFTFHGQTYFACNDESHGGGGGFRSTIIAYVHYRANGTIAPIRIDETGVGNYNISSTVAAGLKVWTIEAEDFYAIEGGAVKRQKAPTGADQSAFEVSVAGAGGSLSFPRVYSHNEKMQLTVLYSNGGTTTGTMEFMLKGVGDSSQSLRPKCKGGGACCPLPPTGSWDVYKNISCGAPGRYSANVRTGMMPDVSFNFTGPAVAAAAATEFARVDAFNWLIYD